METLHVKGVGVTFDDLTEEVQRNLYLKHRERLQLDAAKSQYSEIRELVVKEKNITLEVLNEMFKAELEIWQDVNIIRSVWNHENFKRTDDKRQLLAESTDGRIRLIAAKCEDSSSDFLNEILRNEAVDEERQNLDVIDAILSNPKFQMEQETLKCLGKSESWKNRIRAARYEYASSEFLNEMLRDEVTLEEYDDCDVKNAILSNPKFQMEQETLKSLGKSEYWRNRIIAAEHEYVSSEFLNEMFRNEVQNEEYQYKDVIDAIISNPKFQMEQETLKCLGISKFCDKRIIAVKHEYASSEFLNEVLRNEVQNEEYQYKDVIDAIICNPKFQMEQETLKVLVESGNWRIRLIAVRSKEISIELLDQMYQKEDDEDVKDAIRTNLLDRVKISKGERDLNFVQKERCIEILEKVRKEEGKALTEYLQEILDVIG